MADDINKTGEGEEINEPEESKDWQWDAAAPTVGDDFLDLETILPEEKEEINDDEADEASDAEETDSPDAENESEEVVIEDPEEEDKVHEKNGDHISVKKLSEKLGVKTVWAGTPDGISAAKKAGLERALLQRVPLKVYEGRLRRKSYYFINSYDFCCRSGNSSVHRNVKNCGRA